MSHILLIEDDDYLRETVKHALEREFFRVRTAACLKEGVRQILLWRPSFIITDYWIELEFADDIITVSKENVNNPVPILLYSGWEGISDLAKTKKVQGVLKKPFKVRELMTSIADFMPIDSLSTSNADIDRFLGAYQTKSLAQTPPRNFNPANYR